MYTHREVLYGGIVEENNFYRIPIKDIEKIVNGKNIRIRVLYSHGRNTTFVLLRKQKEAIMDFYSISREDK